MPKLSKAERAILIKQFEILGAIEGDRNAYKQSIEVLSSGFESEYRGILDGLSDPLPKADCKFVHDILYLYFLLKSAKNKAALDDPGGNRDQHGMLIMADLEPKFPGFDGNTEGRYLSYANYLIFQDDSYPEHKHYLGLMGSRPDYQAMLDLWRSWECPLEMSDEQVDELLSVR